MSSNLAQRSFKVIDFGTNRKRVYVYDHDMVNTSTLQTEGRQTAGRSDGGYIGIYTPKICPSKFLWGKITSEWLFDTVIPPKQKTTNFWLRP